MNPDTFFERLAMGWGLLPSNPNTRKPQVVSAKEKAKRRARGKAQRQGRKQARA